MSDDNTSQYLTVEAVAIKLNLNVATIRRWIREKKLPAKKVGKSYLLTQASINALVGEETTTETNKKPKHLHAVPGVNSMIIETIIEMADNLKNITEIKEILEQFSSDLLPLFEKIKANGITDVKDFIDYLAKAEAEETLRHRQDLVKSLINKKTIVFLPLPPHIYDSLYASVPDGYLFLTEDHAQHHLEKAPYQKLTLDNISDVTLSLGHLSIVVVDGQEVNGKLLVRSSVASVLEFMSMRNLKKIYLHKIPHIPKKQSFAFFDYKKHNLGLINI